MEELYKIGKFNIRILLNGDPEYDKTKNCKIFLSVHKYIEATKRFN